MSCLEVNSTCYPMFELANQSAQKMLSTVIVHTNKFYC